MTKEINLKKRRPIIYHKKCTYIYTDFEYDKGQQKIFTKVNLSYV